MLALLLILRSTCCQTLLLQLCIHCYGCMRAAMLVLFLSNTVLYFVYALHVNTNTYRFVLSLAFSGGVCLAFDSCTLLMLSVK
jgi:hypothetical protein